MFVIVKKDICVCFEELSVHVGVRALMFSSDCMAKICCSYTVIVKTIKIRFALELCLSIYQ